MKLRYDTTWADVVGLEVWAKYSHSPVMLTFRVLGCAGTRMQVDRRPSWGPAVDCGGGVWEVEQADFRLLDA